MQNVVEVACSSPPGGMNATRPAAQAVQVAEQDPFDLVLQKASERIGNDKQSDNASNCRDSKSADKSNGSESSANSKISVNKNEREVDNTNETTKNDKPQKSDKPENSDETDKNSELEAKDDQATMVYGYVAPASTVIIENTDLGTSVDTVSTDDAVEQAVQPANLVQISSTTPVEEETELTGNNVASDQTTEASTMVLTDENEVEPESKLAISESLNNSAKGDEKATTDLKSVSVNSDEEVAINIAKNNQEVTLKTEVAADKTEIPADVEPGQQTAPPDNPDGTTAVTASATVQNTTQISEPARLAEAPKNEVTTQVAEQISQMVKSNRTSVRMQLYPEELGHIDLRIVTTKNGIGVTMVADKASTQQALKSEMDLLKQSIEQAGIQLSNLNINQGHNSNKQQAFEQRQNFSNSSYTVMNSDNSNSTSDEPRVHLNSSVVDYRV